jgi:hypothetical protein
VTRGAWAESGEPSSHSQNVLKISLADLHSTLSGRAKSTLKVVENLWEISCQKHLTKNAHDWFFPKAFRHEPSTRSANGSGEPCIILFREPWPLLGRWATDRRYHNERSERVWANVNDYRGQSEEADNNGVPPAAVKCRKIHTFTHRPAKDDAAPVQRYLE